MENIQKYLNDDVIDYLQLEPYNVPDKLKDIEQEIVKISKQWSIATWLLGERFEKIRELKLYLEKGYNTFEEYIEECTPYSRSSAYNIIDVKKYFNPVTVERLGSKSTLMIPVLRKIEKENIERLDEFKKDVVPMISNVTFKKAREVISDYYLKNFDNNNKSTDNIDSVTKTKKYKKGKYTVIEIKKFNTDIKISDNEIVIDTLDEDVKVQLYAFLKKMFNIKDMFK